MAPTLELVFLSEVEELGLAIPQLGEETDGCDVDHCIHCLHAGRKTVAGQDTVLWEPRVKAREERR